MKLQKHDVLIAIVAQLDDDLLVLERAVSVARDTATHADCLCSSKYETMGLEASYLAQGQGQSFVGDRARARIFQACEFC